MVRWLLGMKNNHSKSGTSTLRLLTTILHSDGDLTEQGKIRYAIILQFIELHSISPPNVTVKFIVFFLKNGYCFIDSHIVLLYDVLCSDSQ